MRRTLEIASRAAVAAALLLRCASAADGGASRGAGDTRPPRDSRLIGYVGHSDRAIFPSKAGAAVGDGEGGKEPAAYEPTERYETRQVEGWTVLVHRGFLADEPELADRTLTLLRNQLYQVARRLPAGAVDKLRRVRIWVEEREPHHPCMAYHPGAGWLRDHGMNPEKARCVEVANARNFLRWTRDQPWMVLHELAHGYHHQFLEGGYENAEVRAAFEAAKASKRYDSVLHINGREERAYALSNPMEYFAEASEAFFGTNDFYPFVRPELKRHDPDLFGLLTRLWEAP